MYSECASRGLAVSQCFTSSEGVGSACIALVQRLYGVYIDCASRGLAVCFTNPELFSLVHSCCFLWVCGNCFLLMASQARKSGKRMLAFFPASATKDPKKGRTAVGGAEDGSQDEGMQEPDICDSINTADIHEIVVTRVNETLTAYKLSLIHI